MRTRRSSCRTRSAKRKAMGKLQNQRVVRSKKRGLRGTGGCPSKKVNMNYIIRLERPTFDFKRNEAANYVRGCWLACIGEADNEIPFPYSREAQLAMQKTRLSLRRWLSWIAANVTYYPFCAVSDDKCQFEFEIPGMDDLTVSLRTFGAQTVHTCKIDA